MILHQRALLGAGLAALAAGPALAQAATAPETLTTQVDGRTLAVRVWRPAQARGVILFSHGGNGDVDNYAALTERWAADGWLVLAPVHADSVELPPASRASLQAAYPLRMAEMRAASALAAAQAPGLPAVAAGHSYGALFAAMAGGALADRGGVRDPSVRGVVMLSSPGVIPGLISPQAYATLAVPLMVMTGDADLVPGLVTDWRAHLHAFETAPAGDRLAVVWRGGDHAFGLRDADGTRATAIADLTADFMAAHALNDEADRRRLQALASNDLHDIRRR